MLPTSLLQGPPDRKGGGFEIDIRPLQAQHLPLTETESQSELPASRVAMGEGCGEDRLGLGKRQRLDFPLVGPSGPGCGRRVAFQLPPTDGLPETGPERAVCPLDRGDGDAPGDKAYVDLLKMSGVRRLSFSRRSGLR